MFTQNVCKKDLRNQIPLAESFTAAQYGLKEEVQHSPCFQAYETLFMSIEKIIEQYKQTPREDSARRMGFDEMFSLYLGSLLRRSHCQVGNVIFFGVPVFYVLS